LSGADEDKLLVWGIVTYLIERV